PSSIWIPMCFQFRKGLLNRLAKIALHIRMDIGVVWNVLGEAAFGDEMGENFDMGIAKLEGAKKWQHPWNCDPITCLETVYRPPTVDGQKWVIVGYFDLTTKMGSNAITETNTVVYEVCGCLRPQMIVCLQRGKFEVASLAGFSNRYALTSSGIEYQSIILDAF